MTNKKLLEEIRKLADTELAAWRELRAKRREFEAARGQAALAVLAGDGKDAKREYAAAVSSMTLLEDVIAGCRARREELLKQELERALAGLEAEAERLEREATELLTKREKLLANLAALEGCAVRILPATPGQQLLSDRLRNEAERLRAETRRRRAAGPPADGWCEAADLDGLIEAMLRTPALVPRIEAVTHWWDRLAQAARGHNRPIEAARLVWRNGRIHEDASFALAGGVLLKVRTEGETTLTTAERTTRTLGDIPLPIWLADRPLKPPPPPPATGWRPPEAYRLEGDGICHACKRPVTELFLPLGVGRGLCRDCYERSRVREPRVI